MSGEDDTRGLGLFRGSEFPKLLIMAGLLIGGWLLVFSYALPARKKPRPVNPAIAAQPKLPPADEALVGILDRAPRTARDDAPVAMLLDRVRKEPEKLSREARLEVVPYDLLRSPKRYRGLPIRMEGYATQVYAVDDWDPSVSPSGRLYEVWFTHEDHDERKYPCILFIEDAPPTLPGGRMLHERVAFEGYFLRLYEFRQADNRLNVAPMLVGRLAHTPGAAEADAAPEGAFSDWLWRNRWTIVPVSAAIYISLRIAFKLARPRARPAPRTFSRPSDTIDPSELEQWVEGGATDEDAP